MLSAAPDAGKGTVGPPLLLSAACSHPGVRTCVLAEVKALEAAVSGDGAVHIQADVQRRGACKQAGRRLE